MAKKIKVKYEEIKTSPLFAGVPDKVIKKIAAIPAAQEIATGTVIVKENDPGDSMFIIISGNVDVLKGEKKLKLASLGAGVFLGEGACVSGAPRNATLVATSPVKVAMFDKEAFNKLIVSHPAIPVTLMKVHNERCKDTVRKVNGMKSKGFMAIAALGGLMLIKNAPSLIPIPSLQPLFHQIAVMLPDQLMAVGGPGAIAAFLKFQKMDMGDIVSKLEKL